MYLIFWIIFIVGFFFTLFAIIIGIIKRFHGWKLFFVILSIFNLLGLSFDLLISLERQILTFNPTEPFYIIGWVGVLARLYLRPVVIIDTVSILLYLVQRFLVGEVKKTEYIIYVIWFVIFLIILSHIYDAIDLANKFLLSVGL